MARLGRLALSRQIGEEVVIGDPQNPIGIVRIVDIPKRSKVRLCFEFPKEVKINRREVIEKLQDSAPPERSNAPPKDLLF